MPTQILDTSQLGYPDCPRQDPMDTVKDLKSNNSYSLPTTYSSEIRQELHDDPNNDENSWQFCCESFNIDLRQVPPDLKELITHPQPPETSTRLRDPNVQNPGTSSGFEDMTSAKDDIEHKRNRPENYSVGQVTSCVPLDISYPGFEPCEDVARRGGCNPMDQFDEDTRIRPTSKLQSFSPEPENSSREKEVVSADISLQQSKKYREGFPSGASSNKVNMPFLPPEPDIFKDLPELSSDIEQRELEKLYTQSAESIPLQALLPGYGDVMVSLHPSSSQHSFSPSSVKFNQSFDSSLEFPCQGQNSLPAGNCSTPGQPDKSGGLARLPDDRCLSQYQRKRNTTTWNCQEKSYQTQESQEPPRKTARVEDSAKKRIPIVGCSAGGAVHNPDLQSTLLLDSSAPLGVKFIQQIPLLKTLKVPALQDEQPSVPPDETCSMETKIKLGQKIQSRFVVKSQGSQSINGIPKPEQQMSYEELKRKKKRERNRETARKAREKQRNTVNQLQEEVKNLETERDRVNKEIGDLTRELMALHGLLYNHHCQAGSRMVTAAQAAWQNQPDRSAPGQELAFSRSQLFP